MFYFIVPMIHMHQVSTYRGKGGEYDLPSHPS